MHGRPKYGRGLIMSVAVFGKLSNLRIGCDHGERHFYGSVAVEASHKIEPHWLKDPKQWLEGAVHIFGQGSEECYSRLIIGGEQEQIQHLLKSFSELTSLAVVRRYKDFLAITLMLTFADFNWFSSFVEAHYVNDLEYLFRRFRSGWDNRSELSSKAWDVRTYDGEFLLRQAVFHSE